MISDHPSFKHPTNRDIPLWRYMDLSKLVSMFQEKAVYFGQLAALADPFEGSFVSKDVAFRHIKSNVGLFPEYNQYIGLSDNQIMTQIEAMFFASRKVRDKIFVSCWHMNEQESAAMWSLYSKTNESVCIKTTFYALANQLPPWIMASEVEYIDYTKQGFDFGNGFNAPLRKRKSYDHERELRAVIWSELTDFNAQDEMPKYYCDGGYLVKVDLNQIIQEIYVNPDSPKWFTSLVSALAKDYGITAPVLNSGLLAKPIY